jgi:hypothetical protein
LFDKLIYFVWHNFILAPTLFVRLNHTFQTRSQSRLDSQKMEKQETEGQNPSEKRQILKKTN